MSDGREFDIAVVNADGSGKRRLTRGGFDLEPAWSPDGTTIAFAREASIYLMNADGSKPRRLTSSHMIDGSPAWRPPPVR